MRRAVLGVLRPCLTFAATLTVMLLYSYRQYGWKRGFAPLAFGDRLLAEIHNAATYLVIFCILATVFHPQSLTTRFLESRPLRFIGRISYSLYLWHVLVNYAWNFLGSTGPGPLQRIPYHWLHSLAERPARYATAFLVAYLSYRFVEKPMIRRGHKLAPAATPGRPELADLPLESPAPGFVAG